VLREDLHMYLLIGQSYRQGGGPVEDYAAAPDSRILKLTEKNVLEVAGEPLFDRPGKDHTIGPGMYFAQAMLDAAPPDVSIGLVPVGLGGTRVAGWETVVAQAAQALSWRIVDAGRIGTVKGIVWHAGVSDSRINVFERFYDIRFLRFLGDLCMRIALSPDTPVIVGHVGPYATDADDTHFIDLADQTRGMISGYLSHCTVGEAIPRPGDRTLHFPVSAQEIMGKRYAEAMLKHAQLAPLDEQDPEQWWPSSFKAKENVTLVADIGHNTVGAAENVLVGVGEGEGK
jgi:hypothetical protein